MSKDVYGVLCPDAETALENEAYFSDLDGVVGDGDFGYSLARGFEKVVAEWDSMDHSLPGNFLKKVGMTIMSAVGGVSGTIWGTVFMRSGMNLGTKTEIIRDDVISVLRAAIESIKQRGKCDLGDKTYLDTLIPTVDALEKAFDEGKSDSEALAIAAKVSAESAEATRQMIAKRGRAAYTGERSIGTLDAGSVAVAKIFEKINKDWNG